MNIKQKEDELKLSYKRVEELKERSMFKCWSFIGRMGFFSAMCMENTHFNMVRATPATA